MEIKSAASPAEVVKNASGHECLAYAPKSNKKEGE